MTPREIDLVFWFVLVYWITSFVILFLLSFVVCRNDKLFVGKPWDEKLFMCFFAPLVLPLYLLSRDRGIF
jgi:hypothetical protein